MSWYSLTHLQLGVSQVSYCTPRGTKLYVYVLGITNTLVVIPWLPLQSFWDNHKMFVNNMAAYLHFVCVSYTYQKLTKG